MLIELSLLFLLPIATTTGWIIGKKEQRRRDEDKRLRNTLHRDYFKGLNFLINEESDKAVDVFIKLLEVDSDTVETHLALGSLFRRKGEVDRAIRVHQNLIARPQLEKKYKAQALSALGQDYLNAGVLDRAERIFLELIKLGEENKQSLKFLLHIYQQEKDWENAIEIARKLEQITRSSYAIDIAQYYCELAEQMREKGLIRDAYSYLKRAQAIDSNCVRASLIGGKLAVLSGDYKEAIRCYKKVKQQDINYITEITAPLAACYIKVNGEEDYINFLYKCLDESPRFSVILAISEYLKNKKGLSSAIDFLSQHIKQNPTFRSVSHLISLYRINAKGDAQEKLEMLQDLMHRLLAEKPLYQCKQCGFSSKSLFWLCPGCHQWGTVKPIQGLEGS